MTMSREELVEQLLELAGPLGPFGSLESKDKVRERLPVADKGFWNVLLNVILRPPSLPAAVSHSDFDLELSDSLARSVTADPDRIQALRSLLDVPRARGVALDAVASLRRAESVPWLADLLHRSELSETDLVRLVDALGEIGGDDATLLLRQLRSRADLPLAARREIEITLR
jgi:hypothetical protein